MPDTEQEIRRVQRSVLGWGIACEPIMPGVDLGRDLRLSSGPQGLDFARVEGMDNLGQTLSMALTTALGSDIFNVEFGFDGLNALAEETDAIMQRERIRIAVIKLLHKEPRVRRIIDVKLEDGQLEIPVPGSRELNVHVVFETIGGDQATVSVGKVIPYV